jgi:hypothetical protein
MSMLFLVLALISIVFGIVFMIMITSDLSKRGIKINFILLRLYIIKYVHQYRNITKEESGKPGPFYYPFVVSMCLALFFVIIGVILKYNI